MSVSTSHLAYTDCLEAFGRALEDKSGIRIRFADEDSAIYFRMRCHTARKLDREHNKAIYDINHPAYGASAFDPLVLRIKQIADQWWLYIEKQAMIEDDRIEPLSGAIEYASTPQIEDKREETVDIEEPAKPELRRI